VLVVRKPGRLDGVRPAPAKLRGALVVKALSRRKLPAGNGCSGEVTVGGQRGGAWMETLWAVLVSVGLVVGGLLLLAVLVRMAGLARRDSRRPRKGRRYGRRRRGL
jgi:hypothetical protein